MLIFGTFLTYLELRSKGRPYIPRIFKSEVDCTFFDLCNFLVVEKNVRNLFPSVLHLTTRFQPLSVH